MGYSTEDIAGLVQPTRFHRNIYTDPEIFELEMERLWARSWIYIGHQSQVPEPGSLMVLAGLIAAMASGRTWRRS